MSQSRRVPPLLLAARRRAAVAATAALATSHRDHGSRTPRRRNQPWVCGCVQTIWEGTPVQTSAARGRRGVHPPLHAAPAFGSIARPPVPHRREGTRRASVAECLTRCSLPDGRPPSPLPPPWRHHTATMAVPPRRRRRRCRRPGLRLVLAA